MSTRVCNALGIAAGDRCQKPAGHDGPHEGAISTDATGSRAAKLPPSEQALLDRIMGVLDQSPYADETAASSEVCWRLDHFKALHALERKREIRVEYEQDDCWIGRPDA